MNDEFSSRLRTLSEGNPVMALSRWFRSFMHKQIAIRSRRVLSKRTCHYRPLLETLEDRTMPSVSISVANATMNEIGAASPFVSAGSGGLSSPKDLTRGPDGNLYVATGNNSVVRYDGSTGQLIGTFVAAGSGGLSGPYGLAFGPDGNLYVSNRATNNSILRFNGTTGAFIDSFVAGASDGLAGPDGVAFGADGNLYVVSNGTSSILRFQGPSGASPGSPLPAKGQTGANFVATGSGGLSNPADLVFGPDGYLYVSSQILPVGTSKQAVLKFNGTTGAFISTYVAPGAGGLIDPRGLAFDQEGRLYVADVGISAVHRYGNAGQYLDDPVVIGDPAVVSPVGLIFDAQGRLLIASRDSNAISRYDQGVTVTLSQASPTPVSVGYATIDNSATAGIDYKPQSGSITFAAGQTTRLILLSTHNDARVDGSETFYVDLSNPIGDATIATDRAVVTIVDGDEPTWSAADSMAVTRIGPTATLLTNGKVLVDGGYVSGTNAPSYSLSSAELYDPTTNRWSFAPPTATPRDGGTATLLSNGKVLVAGGHDKIADKYLSSAELYDPVSNTWSSAGSMAHPRIAPTATLLADGKVLVAGGYNGTTTLVSAELYDPATYTWSAAGSMPIARFAQTATLLGNGKVLIVGGIGAAFQSLADAELYDPINNRWSSAGSLATARDEHTATLLNNGKVLVAGGNDFVPGAPYAALSSAELYDPATNTWSAAASMATARQEHTATLLVNGKVLVEGGQDLDLVNSPNIDVALSSAELYDPVSNTWSSAGSMANARIGQTATLLDNGKVLVAGGFGQANYALASAELYDPGLPDPSQSTLAVTPASVPVGGTATVTLTAKDGSSNQLARGGLTFSFGLGAGTGSGTFSNLTDSNNGTYTATFTGTTPGPISITATLNGQAITSTLPTITVTPAASATQFIITNLSTTSILAGGTVTFTVTAEDNNGTPLPGYTGTVQLTSTDGQAALAGQSLPTSYTFVPIEGGTHTFTVTLATPGTKTITVTDQANSSLTATTSPITVNSNPAKFLVKIPGASTIVAGNPFLITVQAVDASGSPVTSYSGPTSVAFGSSPPDPQGSFTGTLNSSGFGFFLENLKTAGSYTLTATAGTLSGTSGSLTVAPSDASYFTVTAPTAATTGSPVNLTVTAFDHFGNIATGYTGTVKLTTSDPSAATLVGSYAFTTGAGKDNGVHTFSTTLKTGGSQTIMATDTAATNPAIVGSSSTIATRGLTVSAFTPTATGFTAAFTKPFVPSNLSLWGGTVGNPIQDVTLIGDKSGPINGSLIVGPTNTSITFKASAIYLSAFFQSPVLSNDTWHVRLVSGSGSNGFVDALGAGLDGANNGGHSDYTTTFTTAYDGKPALSIPDFARGPDGGHVIKVPHESAGGIPVTLSNAAAVTDVVFSLSYNPQLVNPKGAGTADAPAGSAFSMGSVTSIDATHATAIFAFHNNSAQSGTVVLGDILASVPDAAANQYKAKELLSLGSITVNGGAFTGVAAGGLHVNAYLGDVTGNGTITGLDVATANTVAQGNPGSPMGLAAYRLVDPAIIGDIAGDASIDATAVSDLAAFTSNLYPLQIPAPPPGLTITPSGPDPTLSLGTMTRIGNPSYMTVPVLLDNPRPQGSTGMTEAMLALTYDPKVLTVSAGDITPGSIPGLGSGWKLVSVVDQVTGRIGIDLYSLTAVTAAQAGSLVNIVFHVVPGASTTATAVQLVSAVTVNGEQFGTQVDDSQGQFVLSPGVDQVVVKTKARPVGLLAGRRLPSTVRGET
jgi:N-acetylneuraminic acid mutarotase